MNTRCQSGPFFITIGIADWMTPRPSIYSGVALIIVSLC
jgi:hypothetical protein